MEQIYTVRELIGLWPTRQALVEDMKLAVPWCEVTVGRVHKWAENSSIPAKFHQSILAAARQRKFPVSADLLIELHAIKGRGSAA